MFWKIGFGFLSAFSTLAIVLLFVGCGGEVNDDLVLKRQEYSKDRIDVFVSAASRATDEISRFRRGQGSIGAVKRSICTVSDAKIDHYTFAFSKKYSSDFEVSIIEFSFAVLDLRRAAYRKEVDISLAVVFLLEASEELKRSTGSTTQESYMQFRRSLDRLCRIANNL